MPDTDAAAPNPDVEKEAADSAVVEEDMPEAQVEALDADDLAPPSDDPSSGDSPVADGSPKEKSNTGPVSADPGRMDTSSGSTADAKDAAKRSGRVRPVPITGKDLSVMTPRLDVEKAKAIEEDAKEEDAPAKEGEQAEAKPEKSQPVSDAVDKPESSKGDVPKPSASPDLVARLKPKKKASEPDRAAKAEAAKPDKAAKAEAAKPSKAIKPGETAKDKATEPGKAAKDIAKKPDQTAKPDTLDARVSKLAAPRADRPATSPPPAEGPPAPLLSGAGGGGDFFLEAAQALEAEALAPDPEPEPEPEPESDGTLIDGRYELIEIIGEGGFGAVYRGRQVSTGQIVAIKLLHADLVDSDNAAEYVARFEREMRLIGSLAHPNIVRLIDTGRVDGSGELFMVIEFVDGRTLFDIIEADGPMAPREALHIMRQVLDALHAAHKLGIVHRDLKPHNIMLTDTGYLRNAMVLDYGISGVVEGRRGVDYRTLTRASEIRGTPSYMAPEQLRGSKINPQSDLYAWGLVFLECLMGKPVVDGDSPFEIALTMISDDPIIVPDGLVNDAIYAILSKVTEKSTERRYTSAVEIFQRLDAAEALAMPLGPPSLDDEEAPTLRLDTSSIPGLEASDADTALFDRDALEAQAKKRLRSGRPVDVDVNFDATDPNRRRVTLSGRHQTVEEPASSRMGFVLALLGILAGALMAVAGTWYYMRSQAPPEPQPAATADEPTVSEEMESILEILRGEPSYAATDQALRSLNLVLKANPQDPAGLSAEAAALAIRAQHGWEEPGEGFTRARETAERAIELDPTQAWAHAALARVRLFYERDPTAAQASFKRAIELDPRHALDYARYQLAPMRRFEEARGQIDAVNDADLVASKAIAAATIELLAGDYNLGLSFAGQALQQQPGSFDAHMTTALLYAAQNRHTEAIGALQAAKAIHNEPKVMAAMGNVEARAGNTEKARAILDALKSNAKAGGRVQPDQMARVELALGDLDAAFASLDKAYDTWSGGLLAIRADPMYQPLQADPRFTQLTTKLGL